MVEHPRAGRIPAVALIGPEGFLPTLDLGGNIMARTENQLVTRGGTNWMTIVFVWLVVSAIWLGGVFVLRPAAGSQIKEWVFVIYLLAGPFVTALALILLHSIDHNIFSSAQKAAPIGAVFVGIFAFFGYLVSAERGSRSGFLEEQLESCIDIADTVGTMAAVSDKSLWKSSYDKFWTYYWGRVGVFENHFVEGRMVEFGDLAYVNYDLQKSALCVAHTCKAQAQASWSVVPGLIRAELGPDQYCDAMHEEFIDFCGKYINKPHHHQECDETIPGK
jgi:hypothetical protein